MKTDPERIRIGILDSDLGGLRLVAAIAAKWPLISICYLADTAHHPVGERSPDLIRWRLHSGLDYLHDQGATLAILTGQTMAALFVDDDSPNTEPAPLNPVRLAAAAAAGISVHGRIGLIASRATVDSDAYPHCIGALRPTAVVHSVAAPLLVPLMDEGRESKPEGRMIIKKYLHRLKVRQVDTLILGTSRCGQIEGLIQAKIGPRVRLVDPLACTLDALVDRLPSADGQTVPHRGLGPHHRLAVTDLEPGVLSIARKLLKRPVDLVEIHL